MGRFWNAVGESVGWGTFLGLSTSLVKLQYEQDADPGVIGALAQQTDWETISIFSGGSAALAFILALTFPKRG